MLFITLYATKSRDTVFCHKENQASVEAKGQERVQLWNKIIFFSALLPFTPRHRYTGEKRRFNYISFIAVRWSTVKDAVLLFCLLSKCPNNWKNILLGTLNLYHRLHISIRLLLLLLLLLLRTSSKRLSFLKLVHILLYLCCKAHFSYTIHYIFLQLLSSLNFHYILLCCFFINNVLFH